jgi:hypothetical protein
MRPIGLITVVLAALLGGVGLASSAHALTLNVATNGVDSPTCGKAVTPCRTISQAADNANAGDRILVGPGVYGDLNQDGDLTDSGEEGTGAATCSCMLQITKRLTFESSAGAAMTIIRGTTNLIAVSLEASGISFGLHDRGFTITSASSGLKIIAGADGVRVTGNVIHGPSNGRGIWIEGDSAVIKDNDIRDWGQGVWAAGPGYTITGNAIVRNFGYGVLVSAGGEDGTVSGNAIIGNTFVGVWVLDQVNGVTLTRNAIHGNNLCGVRIGESNQFPDPQGVVVTQNNIYGNGAAQLNCGLEHIPPSAGQVSPVQASRNFWGAASGPGDDPADEIYPADQVGGDDVVFEPFATKRFNIAVDAGK